MSFVVQTGLEGTFSVGSPGESGAVEKYECDPELCIKSMKSFWWKGGVGKKSGLSNTPSTLDPLSPCSIWGAATSVVSCRRGDVVPPNGPVFGSNRERSPSSRRGYINRVRYEAEGGTALLGLSKPLLWQFLCAAEVLIGLVIPPEFRFLFPDLDDGL